jgi:hypothetical protein
MAAIALAIAVSIALAACGKRATVTACTDDLAGAWRSESGQRWMIIDGGKALEAYTLFDDTHPSGAPAGIELGPRVMDLQRTPQGADGDVKRRYLHAGDECVGRAPAHLVSCREDTLELVLADPAQPSAYAPCQWGRPEASRRERWSLEAK